jgi:hypothetical protein
MHMDCGDMSVRRGKPRDTVGTSSAAGQKVL